MKLNRKWLLAIALVLSLTMAIGGTLAYLTDRDTVENTFTMGNVDIEVEEDFPEEGSPIKPGEEVNKDAQITNTGNNPAWVWMTVSIPETLKDYVTLNWTDDFANAATGPEVVDGQAVWTVLVEDQLPVGESTEYILDSVTLSRYVDYQNGEYVVVQDGEKTPLEGLVDGQLIVTVTGYAAQVEGLDTVAEAYAAYQGQWGDGGADDDEDPDHVCWDGTADTSWYNDTNSEFVITTAEQLAGLAELVDNGNTFAGKTIKLGNDICLGGEQDTPIHFNPIGHSSNNKSFNGTFDGQEYEISNLYMQSNLDSGNGGWLYEGEYYGLFAYTDGATIKNVTVADAYISSGRNEAAGVVGNAVDTTFENISIEGATLIGYNNSVGGVASECYGDCSFTDITVDEDTVLGPLWGTYDVCLGGVVGMVKSGNKVSLTNVSVSCKLDAINDVAANDQWWNYRYCGMLIGNVPGSNGVANPSGLVTCENVTVTYGDWVDYHYCEFASLGAGSYNPPGVYKYARVEAGTGTDGIDLSTCNHNEDESHNELITFDQLFGGNDRGVYGLKSYEGVTVVYPD